MHDKRPPNDEATSRRELVRLLKGICCSPDMQGQDLEPVIEANIISAADYLLKNFDDQDGRRIIDNLSTLDSGTRSIVEGLITLAIHAGYAIHCIAKLPESDGYEPWLAENGFKPIAARGLSHLIKRSASRRAKDLQWMGPVVKAIRALAKPGRTATRNIEILLRAANETTVFETIFDSDLDREKEFIGLLECALLSSRGPRLVEIAASLATTLTLPRGPKAKASSIAHEILLRQDPTERFAAYTYNDIEGDYTDALTLATRREFGEETFNPRAARNRIRQRANKS